MTIRRLNPEKLDGGEDLLTPDGHRWATLSDCNGQWDYDRYCDGKGRYMYVDTYWDYDSARDAAEQDFAILNDLPVQE